MLLLLLLLFTSTLHALTFTSSHAVFAFRGGASSKNDADTTTTSAKAKTKPRKRSKKARSKPDTASSSASESNTSTRNPIMEEVLKHDDFYKVLGTTKEQIAASKNPDKDIQKAYRKRAVHTHPDKTGGNRSAFDKVAEAYEGLQDAEKRQLYDRFGKEGAQRHAQGGGGGMNAEDLFRRFFGGGRNPFADAFGQQQQQQRGPAMYIYDVSLEALYHGLTRTVQLPDGQTVTVTVPAGSHDSDVIQNSDNDSVCFRLRTTQHGHFVRKGHDLAVELRISLAESLTGVQRKIRHLNGQVLHVVSAAAGTTSPAPIRTGDVQVLPGYGMPKDADATAYGDLYIQYEVVPVPASSRLTADERRELKRLLLKLEGKSTTSSTASSSEWPFTTTKQSTMQLQPSSASAFGAGYRRPHDPFASDFNPFGGGGGFFFQGF